jgi:2-dehydro-3-deoxygluconokinase
MGLYWVEMGAGPRASKVYYDRADSAFDKITSESIRQEYMSCDWFHSSGITPGISNRTCSALFRCIELLPPDVPFSMDLNFRSKLWKWADEKERLKVYDSLANRCTLLAGNENDFQACFGISAMGNTVEEIYSSIANTIFSRYTTVRYLSVSLRGSKSATINIWSGMLFVRNGSSFDLYRSPSIELDSIIDRLGAGDSFTAGVLHGLSSFEEDFQRVVNFAVMLSALKHTIYGDFCCFTEDEVFEALYSGGSGIIQR